MIVINISKFIALFKITSVALLLALAGNFFFRWDFELGLFVGLILGAWESLYEFMSSRVLLNEKELRAENGEEE